MPSNSLLPLDFEILNLHLQLLGYSLLGSRRERVHTDLPLWCLAWWVHPANLTQGLLSPIGEKLVHPEASTVVVAGALDGDGGPVARLGSDRGDAPVSPGVASNGGDARGAIVELDTSLDPLDRRGRGRVALLAEGE